MKQSRVVTPFEASKFKKIIREMIRQEMEHMQTHKMVGVVDYLWNPSGSKWFADVFLNGYSPKFTDAFTSFGALTTVAGSFSVSGGVATSGATANDLAIVIGSSYGDLTYVCEVDMPAISGTQEVEIILRYQDANNYYALVFANNVVLLRKVVAGTATTLASVAVTFAANTWYFLRFQAQGSRLTGWTSTDGKTWSNQIQATDANFTKGAVGIRDVSLAAQYKQPTVYSGVTPAIPVRPGVGSGLAVGQEVFVERINFNTQDLIVDMPRVV